MALTGFDGTAYLERTAAVGAYPVLISAWGYLDSGAAVVRGALVSIGLAADLNSDLYAVLEHSNDNTNRNISSCVRAGTGSFRRAVTTTNAPTDTWFHAWGTFVSTTSREALLDGASKGTNTNSASPATPGKTRIGLRPLAASDPMGSTNALAEVSHWDGTGMSDTNRDALAAKLAAGEVPTDIDAEVGQPWTGMLLAYWPLADTTDLADASGNGHTMTMVGTLSNFGSHPPVGSPGGPVYSEPVLVVEDESGLVATSVRVAASVAAVEDEAASTASAIIVTSEAVTAVEDEAGNEPDVTIYVHAPADAVEDEIGNVSATSGPPGGPVFSEPVLAVEDEQAGATAHVLAFSALAATEDEVADASQLVRVHSTLAAVEDEQVAITASVNEPGGGTIVFSEPVLAVEDETGASVEWARIFAALHASEDEAGSATAGAVVYSSAAAVEDEVASTETPYLAIGYLTGTISHAPALSATLSRRFGLFATITRRP